MRSSKKPRNQRMVPNRPTPEGIEAGQHLARLYEAARDDAARRAPAALAAVGEPCASCAFRRGTVPNGCPETILDAIKCAVEGVPFLCHMSKRDSAGKFTGLCAGWLVTQRADRPRGKVPWKWTAPDA